MQCPHCGADIDVDEIRPEQECPECGKEWLKPRPATEEQDSAAGADTSAETPSERPQRRRQSRKAIRTGGLSLPIVTILTIAAAAAGAFLVYAIQREPLKTARRSAKRARNDVADWEESFKKQEKRFSSLQERFDSNKKQLRDVKSKLDNRDKQVDELQEKIDALEKKLRDTEAALANAKTKKEEPHDPFSDLRKGMKTGEVRKLLGTPDKRTVGGTENRRMEIWTYGNNRKLHFLNGQLQKWSEEKAETDSSTSPPRETSLVERQPPRRIPDPAKPTRKSTFKPDPNLPEALRLSDEPGLEVYSAKPNADSESMQFAVYVPKTYQPNKPALPLIVSSHGAGGSGPGEADQWKSLAEQYNFFVVCPSYLSARARGTIGDMKDRIKRDKKMLSAILHRVLGSLNIDRRYVLHTGFSNGGIPTYYIAMNHPTVFKALCFRSANFYGTKIDIDHRSAWRKRPIFIFWAKDDQDIIQKQGSKGAHFLKNGIGCRRLTVKMLPEGSHSGRPGVAAKWFAEMVAHTKNR
ncbi:MAG: hypothetical protein ACLFWL_09105 [Candidatus Brocadiia bacterium]